MTDIRKYLQKQAGEDSKKLNSVVKAIYDNGSVELIEKLQVVISKLEKSVVEGNVASVLNSFGVEKIVQDEKKLQIVADVDDKRPILTYETYSNMRKEGLDNAQIMEKFRVEKRKTLGAFAAVYKRQNDKDNGVPKIKPNVVKNNIQYPEPGKPVLNYGIYCNLTAQGYTHEQILEEYTLQKAQAIHGFRSVYLRDKAGKKTTEN